MSVFTGEQIKMTDDYQGGDMHSGGGVETVSNADCNRIVLISLRDPFMDSDRVMPPLGVMSLHSFMQSCGYESVIENDFDVDSIEKYQNFSHFGISCMTPQRNQAYEILNAIRANFPGKVVVLGGPHVKYYQEECEGKEFDYLVVGDGELALKAIMENTPGLSRVVQMPVSESQMNDFPIPYRDQAFLNQYDYRFLGIKATTVLTAKGCPMSCTFCEDARTTVRHYFPDVVEQQIIQIKSMGYEGIMFFDDIFTISIKRVRELAGVIRKHNIKFRCFGHAKRMTDEMCTLLADAGCVETGFGAESGSQKILDITRKRTTVQANMDYIERCNRHGIRVKAFLMLGLPGENLQTIAETREFLEFLMSQRFKSRLGMEISNDFDMTIFFPYKGTAIRNSLDEGTNEYDLFFVGNAADYAGFYKGKCGSSDTILRTSALTQEELVHHQRELLDTFKKQVIQGV
ncbi:MAG: B12-binding domain-containing radical SAM protein [Magnetococcales bacterium]|nr:B12-binding domain-containing radical SAM protein [Magnetococcales bacterium]